MPVYYGYNSWEEGLGERYKALSIHRSPHLILRGEIFFVPMGCTSTKGELLS